MASCSKRLINCNKNKGCFGRIIIFYSLSIGWEKEESSNIKHIKEAHEIAQLK